VLLLSIIEQAQAFGAQCVPFLNPSRCAVNARYHSNMDAEVIEKSSKLC
jgi:hypothetical protein